VDEGLEIRRKALGPEHPQVATTLTVKANLMLAMRRYDDALQLSREAERILLLSLPRDSWQVAAAMNTEGAALAQLARYADAERLLLDSQGSLAQAPIPGLADKGRRRLAELYAAWGRPDEARKYE
jgi:tetratricopeptide (TPR) repeat protein